MQIIVSPEFSGHYIKVIIYFQTKLNKNYAICWFYSFNI